MAASVNNIAATFATVPISSSSSTSSSASSNPHQPKFSLSISHKPISTAWNPHKRLPRSQRSSLISLYGPPGPPPIRPISAVHPRPPLITKPIKPLSLSVSVGDKLPNVTLSYLNQNDTVQFTALSSLCKGKRVVLAGVSAPFSPRCALFLKQVESAREKNADLIACFAVSDVFVMRAWGEKLAVGDKVMMLSDGRGELANALGVSRNSCGVLDLKPKRFCLVAFNGVIKSVSFGDEEDTKSMVH